jgi:hypothetical protein
MKILIIGGGWIGCHLAMKLRDKHDVKIFDKNDELFLETSYKNQNRLHYGFHYPRNHKTRFLCKDTYKQFISEYGFLIDDVKKNIYCVPNGSLIDFETYKEIYKNYDFKDVNIEINNCGCILTNEKFINYYKAKEFFNKELKDNFIKKEVRNVNSFKKEYDLIINATNNNLKIEKTDCFYEITLSLIYEKINEIDFDSLTLMDGKFFSIYPYGENKYTLTDVEHTPLKKFKNIKKLNKYKEKIDNSFVLNIKEKMEDKVNQYINFNDNFKYIDYFLSLKVKNNSSTDDRYPTIIKNDNIITCYTGKIQGIFVIENYINKLIYE